MTKAIWFPIVFFLFLPTYEVIRKEIFTSEYGLPDIKNIQLQVREVNLHFEDSKRFNTEECSEKFNDIDDMLENCVKEKKTLSKTKPETAARLYFTYMNFFDEFKEDDTLGIAYTKSLCQTNSLGVIKLREMVNQYKKEDETHLLRIYENLHTILHEIVHIFGSTHDHNRREKECQDKFVMDYNTSPKDTNYLNLSPCSKTEIYQTINEKGGCFILETDKVKRPPIVQVQSSDENYLIGIVVAIVTTVLFISVIVIIKICFYNSKDNKKDNDSIDSSLYTMQKQEDIV